MNIKILPIVTILLSILIAGCIPSWQLTGSEPVQTSGFNVTLPEGWLYLKQSNGTILTSIDGPLVQQVSIKGEPYQKAFKASKQEVGEGVLSHELMDYFIAEIKAAAGDTVITLDSREAALIDGNEGFRVAVSFKNDQGLRLKTVYTAFGLNRQMYVIAYTAPVLYYFEKNLTDYEQVVSSFTLTGTGKS